MKVLLFFQDIAIAHSRFILEAFDQNARGAHILALGPKKRSAAAAIFTVGGETQQPLLRTEYRAVKTYSARETWCRFSEWRKYIQLFQPDVLVVLDEALSVNLLLAAIANWFFGRGVVLFYGFENLIQGTGWNELKQRPSGRTLSVFLRKSLRWVLLDKMAMPLRRRLIHGGLVSYSECAGVIESYGWRPLMSQQYWAINDRVFSPEGPKANLGLTTSFTVGYVGRFIPEKGIADLVSAMRFLEPQIGLTLVGDGPQKAELERLVEEHQLQNRVRFMPPQNQTDLAACYRAMDLLVLPSRTTPTWKEQFGRVLMEARYCGLPVAGSDSGAIPYVIGDPQFIFPEGNVSEMAKMIQKLAHRAKRVGDAGHVGASDFVAAWLDLAAKLSPNR